MKGNEPIGRRVYPLFLLFYFCLFFIGCQTLFPAADQTEEEGSERTVQEKPKHRYYDFPDILIPEGLSLEKDKSFIYETPNYRAGVLVFSGSVEVESLIAFFKENMKRDGWNLISSFKYRTYIMNFTKEQRACMIVVDDKVLSTFVEVWVGPVER